MKKVLLLAVVALFVMMPLASFAMTTISDSDLNAITAQEGVSIYLNNITLSGINATMSWGQTNMSSVTGSAIDPFAFDAGGFVGAVVSTTGNITVNGLLTIDVGVNNTTTLSTTGIPGGIALGLTNMAIGVGGVQMIVKVGATKDLGFAAPTTAMTMGTAFISNVTTTVNGQVLISTH
jgi:hypothetical protein